MANEVIHTVHRGNRWFVEIESEARVYSRHVDKAEAEIVGRELARRLRCAHAVHDINGRVQQRADYDGGTSQDGD